jgi:hypothetical protein
MRFNHHSSQMAFERALWSRHTGSRVGARVLPRRKPLSAFIEWACYRHGGHYALATRTVGELADELLRRGGKPEAIAHDLRLLLSSHGRVFMDMALPIVNERAMKFGMQHG